MHRIDPNDLKFAKERNDDLVGWFPGFKDIKGIVHPTVTRFLKKDGSLLSVFHAKPVYYETVSGHWRPLDEICEHHGNKNIVIRDWSNVHPRFLTWLSARNKHLGGKLLLRSNFPVWLASSIQFARVGHVGLTTLTSYPDPSPETTTVDGWIEVTGTGASRYTNAHDAATGTAVDNSGTYGAQPRWDERGSSTGFTIRRFFAGFDTSSIGSDGIDDGTFSAHVQSEGKSDDSLSLAIVSATLASNTALASGDYDGYGTTHLSSDVDPTTGAYNDLTLNASGEAHINKSGVTNFALMYAPDVDDAGLPSGRNYVDVYASELSGTTTDPKLVVNHSGGGGGAPTNNAVFFGGGV